MPIMLTRKDGPPTPFRNAEYIPFYYFIPKSILSRCGAELNAIAEAAANASGQRASVSLAREDFTAREYEGFALPAGEYLSLRIELEGGAGRNWWCVVFPPLCTALAGEDEDAFALFDEEETELITGSGRVIKFRLLELLEKFIDRAGM